MTVTKPARKTAKGKKLVVTKVRPRAGTKLAGTKTVSITLGFVKK